MRWKPGEGITLKAAVIGQRAHESVPQRMKTLARYRPALA